MKALLPVIALALVFVACGDSSTESDQAVGGIKIEVFDSPPPDNLEAINLTITEVQAHHTGSGWLTVTEPDTAFDFLELVNGVTAVLADTQLVVGKYTQLRLVVADTNEIVIDGESHPLVVPSGTETGVKLNVVFTLEEDQIVEIYVDFDAGNAITWNPDGYLLRPSFKAFAKVVSVKVSGIVTNDLGVGIENALVEAVSSEESATTLTDGSGLYKLILTQGVYDISASADGFTSADTTYTGVEVDPEQALELTGYDFVLE